MPLIPIALTRSSTERRVPANTNLEQSGVCAFGSFARPGGSTVQDRSRSCPRAVKAKRVAPSRASPIEEFRHADTIFSETSFKPDQTEVIAEGVR
jgi:hypothetical protein